MQLVVPVNHYHRYTYNLQDSIVSAQGKLFWNDGRRRIDIKKPIREIFDQIDQDEVIYKMDLCLSKKKLYYKLNELIKEDIIPILLYFENGRKL